jgi:hypothetical protein
VGRPDKREILNTNFETQNKFKMMWRQDSDHLDIVSDLEFNPCLDYAIIYDTACKGTEKLKVEPLPTWLSTHICPP